MPKQTDKPVTPLTTSIYREQLQALRYIAGARTLKQSKRVDIADVLREILDGSELIREAVQALIEKEGER